MHSVESRSATRAHITLLAFVALLCGGPADARAEQKELGVALQTSLSSLPLMVVDEQKLFEKHARAAGLGDVAVKYAKLGNPAAINDALLSGAAQFGGAGTAALITMWVRTGGDYKTPGALSSMPMYLNTTNPALKSLRDLTEKD